MLYLRINRLSERNFEGQEKNKIELTHIEVLKGKFETNGRYTPHYIAGEREIRNLTMGYFLVLLYVWKRSKTFSRISRV